MSVNSSNKPISPAVALPSHLVVGWGPLAAIVVLVLSFALQAIIFIVLLLIASISPAFSPLMDLLRSTNPNIYSSFLFAIISAAAYCLIIFWYIRRNKAGIRDLGWRQFSLIKTILYALVGVMVFVVLAAFLTVLVALLVPSFDSTQVQSNPFIQTANQSQIIALIALVILPPIIEETVFRGFVFPAFAKKTGLKWGAVISSALFGILHLQANVGIYTFAFGLVLCFLYVKLKSIFPGMILHMLNNLLAYIALTGMR